jgi:hypothetical protein
MLRISCDNSRNRMFHRAVAIAIALVLAGSSLALAQSNLSPGGTALPTREGNIWNHQDHQPTEAEVRAAEKAAGLTPIPGGTQQQVEEEVRQFLQQLDRADMQYQKADKDYHGVSSTAPGDR